MPAMRAARLRGRTEATCRVSTACGHPLPPRLPPSPLSEARLLHLGPAPPSAWSTGKRRFLLPRPFATTFIRLHLRMEPLFFQNVFAPRFAHGWASEFAFVGLMATRHKPIERLRPSSSLAAFSTIVGFG